MRKHQIQSSIVLILFISLGCQDKGESMTTHVDTIENAHDSIEAQTIYRNRTDFIVTQMGASSDCDEHGGQEVPLQLSSFEAQRGVMCGQNIEGEIFCWGENEHFGFNNTERGNIQFSKLSLEERFACGLTNQESTTNHIKCFGSNNIGSALTARMTQERLNKRVDNLQTFETAMVISRAEEQRKYLGCALNHEGEAQCVVRPDNRRNFKKVRGDVRFSSITTPVWTDKFDQTVCGITLEDESIQCFYDSVLYRNQLWTYAPSIFENRSYIDVELGEAMVCGLNKTGQIDCEYWNYFGEESRRSRARSFTLAGLYKDLAVLDKRVCGVTLAGQVNCYDGQQIVNTHQFEQIHRYAEENSMFTRIYMLQNDSYVALSEAGSAIITYQDGTNETINSSDKDIVSVNQQKDVFCAFTPETGTTRCFDAKEQVRTDYRLSVCTP